MSFETAIRKPAVFGKRRAPMRVQRTPGERLAEAIFALAEGQALIVIHSESAWASITFAGSRHAMTLSFVGDSAVAAGERFIAALADYEFAIPGQLVADAQVKSAQHTLLPQPKLKIEIELLLLEDS